MLTNLLYATLACMRLACYIPNYYVQTLCLFIFGAAFAAYVAVFIGE